MSAPADVTFMRQKMSILIDTSGDRALFSFSSPHGVSVCAWGVNVQKADFEWKPGDEIKIENCTHTQLFATFPSNKYEMLLAELMDWTINHTACCGACGFSSLKFQIHPRKQQQ
jgi:hypothetical protein